VSQRLPRERSPQVCAAALRALAAIGGEASLGLVTGYLEHEELQVCRGALIGLLRQEDPKAVHMAQSCLEQLTKSSRAQDKRLAAEVMAEIRSGDNGLLMTLLGDETELVRKAAFRAAGRSGNPAYVPVLVEHVSRRKYRRAAEDALIAAGETALTELTEMFENKDLPRQTLARLAKICGRISGETAIQVLLKGFDYPDPEVRKEVLAALARCRYRADESQAQAVRERIRMEIADAVWNLSAIRDLDDDPGLALARRSLGGQAETNRERVFFMLSFLYDRKSIESAWENLRHESKEKRAYALEVLDVTLSQELKQLVLPLVEDMGSPEALRRLQVLFPQKTLTQAERLRETLSRPGEWLSPWNKACAVYSAAGLSGSNLSVTLKSIPVSSSSLLAETTRWALAHLNGSTRPEEQRDRSSGRGNSRMLTIEKVILLKGVNMFSKTSEELLTEVAFILEEVELKPGEVVFEKGDVGESMYIIVDGRVRVYDGDKTINHLGKKEIFGELVLLDPEPRSASVQAVEETRLFRLDRDTFFELMADNIGVVSGVMEVLCQRLRRMTNMAMERR
jgi:hypothetical protein